MFAYYGKNYTLLPKKCQPVRKIFFMRAKNRDRCGGVRGDGAFLPGILRGIVFFKKFTFFLSPRAVIRPVCP